MPISPVNNDFLTDTNYAPGSARIPQRTLGQDDFLKLVLAQLTHQDPMNPQKDTEFIAQMAQFSSLEQAKVMQADIAALRSDQRFAQANSLLGRTVSVFDDQGTLVRGTVSAVEFDAGTPGIVVNGRLFDLSTLVAVEPAPISPAATDDPALPKLTGADGRRVPFTHFKL